MSIIDKMRLLFSNTRLKAEYIGEDDIIVIKSEKRLRPEEIAHLKRTLDSGVTSKTEKVWIVLDRGLDIKVLKRKNREAPINFQLEKACE